MLKASHIHERQWNQSYGKVCCQNIISNRANRIWPWSVWVVKRAWPVTGMCPALSHRQDALEVFCLGLLLFLLFVLPGQPIKQVSRQSWASQSCFLAEAHICLCLFPSSQHRDPPWLQCQAGLLLRKAPWVHLRECSKTLGCYQHSLDKL